MKSISGLSMPEVVQEILTARSWNQRNFLDVCQISEHLGFTALAAYCTFFEK
jgi:hypothetical protein